MSIVDPTWHEQGLLKQGFRSIAGVDETGAGLSPDRWWQQQ
jgi:hypothetical protein